MNQQPPQMNIDLSKTTAIDTPSGGKIWKQGMSGLILNIIKQVKKMFWGKNIKRVKKL